MEDVHPLCCGLDVHRDTVVATIRRAIVGRRAQVETRTFETFADSIDELSKWLDENEVPIVAMEATGVYFKPIYARLRELAPKRTIWVVNPATVKQLRGRKTDVKDSAWIAKLVMTGSLQPSFIPEPAQEELRILGRFRTKTVQEKTRLKNRIVKMTEAQGIKLASVISDVVGVSGRRMLLALLAGRSEEEIVSLADKNLTKKKPLLLRALKSRVSDAAKFVLATLLEELEHIEELVAKLDSEIAQRTHALYEKELAVLKTIPGLGTASIATIVAEVGGDTSIFPSAKHFASWGGFAPGSNESAGKAKRAPARAGNPWLRTALVLVAQTCLKLKNSPWRVFFQRIMRNTGNRQRAIFALAHKLAVTVYCSLRDGVFRPPEVRPLTENAKKRLQAQAITQLEHLGYAVTLSTPTPS